MSISPKDSIAIINYTMQASDNQLRGLSQGHFSPCAQFACSLIENATGKQIAERDLIFSQRFIPHRSVIFDYQSLFNLPIGRILGILCQYRGASNPIAHYVVKLQGNIIIGFNHGGFMRRRAALINGFVVQIRNTDFQVGGQFLYNPNNANEYCRLICFDYILDN